MGCTDGKPRKRHVADTSEWEELRKAKLHRYRCRICGGRAGTLHHLVPRSLGGDDCVDNLVALCGSGTTGCHGLIEHRDPLALGRLRRALRPDELRYMSERKGDYFVDRYYPD